MPASDLPPLEQTGERAWRRLAGFRAGFKRLVYPHRYPVGLDADSTT